MHAYYIRVSLIRLLTELKAREIGGFVRFGKDGTGQHTI